MISRFPLVSAPLLLLMSVAAPAAPQSSTRNDAPAPQTAPQTSSEISPSATQDKTPDENPEISTADVVAPTADTPALAVFDATNAVSDAAIEYSKGVGRLTADSVRVENGVIIAQSANDKGVVFQTVDTRVQAQRIEIDTVGKTLRAEGQVVVERQREALVKPLVASSLESRGIFPGRRERVTETLRGRHFRYDFVKKRGSLDNAELELTGFSVSTNELTINGQRYTARDVRISPGGLNAREREIYGEPPFSLRAREVVVETLGGANLGATGSGDLVGASDVSPQIGQSSTRRRARIKVKGAFLYLGKTRLLPVPSYVFDQLGSSPRNPQAFTLTPRINFNSVDGVLLTTQLGLGLSKNADGAALTADLGFSQRVGFRGGVALGAPTRLGFFSLGLRRNDIVATQLEDRILLDRTPEFTYSSGLRPLFALPGGRVAGLSVSAIAGRYNERLRGGGNRVSTGRVSTGVNFTTRGADVAGPYLDLFARTSRYGNSASHYSNAGFELGYAGQILPRVRGALSYRTTSVSGQTPFRFDLVEIRRELRTTFDIEVTPRYLVPIDLRYDLDQKKLRDQTYGVLRSYKEFAYGLIYQAARREVRVEVRQGF